MNSALNASKRQKEDRKLHVHMNSFEITTLGVANRFRSRGKIGILKHNLISVA